MSFPFSEPVQEAIADSSRRLIEAAQSLGATRWAAFARASGIPFLFDGMERIFATNEEPVAAINLLFDELAGFWRSAIASGIHRIGDANTQALPSLIERAEIETTTGQHYGRLFRAFSKSSYWEEPVALLRTRLERNGINLPRLAECEVLDAGCGGGRYTAAWRLLGAKRAVGVDVSAIGIASAQQRVDEARLDGVTFQEGNVLELPFDANRFDIVFSNGVLHHTVDWQKGVAEIVRVLKPDGLGWLYLIEAPGGLFWALIEVLREVMKKENREYSRIALGTMGIPDNRVFYMLDHVMAPINLRLTPDEIRDCLAAAGASEIRRLQRGADFDRIESIYRNDPYAESKYGVGENRFVFSKH